MKKNFIPFALPSIGSEEVQSASAVIESGWLTTGAKAQQFELDFAQFVGGEFALAVNSATAGLHLALEAVGVGPGDKVITTPYTFTASAEVIRYLGADPLFVDVCPNTFNINTALLKDVLENNKGVKAILPVHFAGQACDMDTICLLAKEYGLSVIEDAAHALPTTYKDKMIGTIGDITVYSFYATKTITTGEGGMVVTNNKAYASRINTMRLHGIDRDVFDRYHANKPCWYYEIVAPGFKYNMTDIAAAIGIEQLKKADDFQQRRAWIAQQYNAAFCDLPLRTPYISRMEDKHAWHLYMLQLDLESLEINRDRFIELMAEEGIGMSVHFIPLHLQPYWRDLYDYKPEDFPVAYDVFQRAASLPIYPKMTDKDVVRVITAVKEILIKYAC